MDNTPVQPGLPPNATNAPSPFVASAPRPPAVEPSADEEARMVGREGPVDTRVLANAAAAVAGAVEGLAEGVRDEGLAARTQHAVHAAGAFVSQVATQAAEEAGRIRDAVTRRASGAGGDAWDASPQDPRSTRPLRPTAQRVQRQVERATAATARAVERARHGIEEVAAEAKERSEALAQGTRNAARAPKAIGRDLAEAAGAYGRGTVRAAGLYAMAGAIGIAAFIVFTVALCGAFNLWLGAPWGTFVVAALYGALLALGIVAARGAMGRARMEAAGSLASAREQVRGVVRPLRRAFGRASRPQRRVTREASEVDHNARELRALGAPLAPQAPRERLLAADGSAAPRTGVAPDLPGYGTADDAYHPDPKA